MAQDAADFAVKHADELAADRHGHAEHPLDGHAERMLLVHRRDVIEPVEIGNGLQIGFVLDELLGAAMEQPDMRVHALHQLAVELQDHAQHAMRGGMLRPEIDGEIAVLGRALHSPRRRARLHAALNHALPLQRYRILHALNLFARLVLFRRPAAGTARLPMGSGSRSF